MAFPKVEEVREMSDQEIADNILDIKKQLANLRLMQATGRLEKPHEFKHARHRLAQLLTIEQERRSQAESEAVVAAAPEPVTEVSASVADTEPVVEAPDEVIADEPVAEVSDEAVSDPAE